jgi:hypothetical protein
MGCGCYEFSSYLKLTSFSFQILSLLHAIKKKKKKKRERSDQHSRQLPVLSLVTLCNLHTTLPQEQSGNQTAAQAGSHVTQTHHTEKSTEPASCCGLFSSVSVDFLSASEMLSEPQFYMGTNKYPGVGDKAKSQGTLYHSPLH